MGELLKEFWGVVIAAIGAIVWLVRLEAGMLSNRRDIRRLEVQRKEDIERADKQRDKIERKLDDIQVTLQKIHLTLGAKEDRR